jgi:uncharacterized protein DUF2505
MGKFTMRHEIDCDVDRFWKLFFDREMNTKLFAHLEFPKWEIVDQREEDKEIVRIIKATPKLDAPGPVRKLLGEGFGYTEDGRYDKASRTFRFVIKPNTLENKLRNEGTVRCEPSGKGESKCTRIVEVTVEAKVFGIGGMVESMTEKSFRDGWGKGATFINQWIKDHP